MCGLEIHAAHSAAGYRGSFLLRVLSDRRLGGDDKSGDRRGVLQRDAHNLGRIDNANLHQINILSVSSGGCLCNRSTLSRAPDWGILHPAHGPSGGSRFGSQGLGEQQCIGYVLLEFLSALEFSLF